MQARHDKRSVDPGQWLAISIAFASLAVALLPSGLGDSARLRVLSGCGFLFLVASTLWLAFVASNRRVLGLCLALVYLGSCSYFLWVGTWLPRGSSPEPVVIDSGDSLTDWATYGTAPTRPTLTLTKGRTTNAMRLSYTLLRDNYVGIARAIDPQVLAGARGVEFYYKGIGAPNTIEIKLITKAGSNNKTITFHHLWDRATDQKNWHRLRAPYGSFTCWGCPGASKLKLDDIAMIDIAVSNKPVDTPGSGAIWIDDIQTFK